MFKHIKENLYYYLIPTFLVTLIVLLSIEIWYLKEILAVLKSAASDIGWIRFHGSH